jgi:hypothetical protein
VAAQLFRDRVHRRRVNCYLKDDSIPPAVFRQLLNEPGFSWERDGEPLLRRHKRAYFERPVYPSVTPTSSRLTEHLR